LIPPSAKSPSLFSPVFFLFEILAHGLFIAAAVLAGRSLRRPESFEPAHRLAVWGFLSYSIAQVTGAIWCYLGWSVPFQWGFRHLHSAVTWLSYVNYLHLRYIPWWTSRRKAWYLVSAALILLAYLIVLLVGESRQLRIGG
jgi:ABC-type transport system involved in cytochrome c biogenesis permease subunit